MKSTGSAEYTYTEGSTGSCLCGGVSYLIKGDIHHVANCFCKQCQKTGGNLFWNNEQRDEISIMAGTLDQPTGLKTTLSIYTADASDFHIFPEIKSIESFK